MVRIRLLKASGCGCGAGLEPIDEHAESSTASETLVKVNTAAEVAGGGETCCGTGDGCCGSGPSDGCCG